MSYPINIAEIDLQGLIYAVFVVLWIVYNMWKAIFGKKEESSPEEVAEEKQRAEDIIEEIRRKMVERSQTNAPHNQTPPASQPVSQRANEKASPLPKTRMPLPEPQAKVVVQQKHFDEVDREAQFDYEEAWRKQQERLEEIKQTVIKVPQGKRAKTQKVKKYKSKIASRLKDPESLKEAIILKEILGPPKSETF